MNKVSIDERQLETLVRKAIVYDYLTYFGVDNWQGYEEVDWYNVDTECAELMDYLKGENNK